LLEFAAVEKNATLHFWRFLNVLQHLVLSKNVAALSSWHIVIVVVVAALLLWWQQRRDGGGNVVVGGGDSKEAVLLSW
jgi:hypothetical protein